MNLLRLAIFLAAAGLGITLLHSTFDFNLNVGDANAAEVFTKSFAKAKTNDSIDNFKHAYKCKENTRPRWPDPCRLWN